MRGEERRNISARAAVVQRVFNGVVQNPSVTLTVVETEPNLKSATATGSFKPAKTETGLTVMVPQFIIDGTRIKVKTDTGEYIERA